MANQRNKEAQPMLIFIPDISGFSKFVNDAEISHSQHIIEELLELIINSNEIGLTVSEVEGDAILFYKEGPLDSIDSIVKQVESMYLKFHSHLKLYEHNRICQCGACSTANSLSLKFVISYGDVSFNKIKDHIKLFGREVIVAHRLLKNKIQVSEYVLLSEGLINNSQDVIDKDSIDWAEIVDGSEAYDIGTVDYKHFELSNLLDRVPTPKREQYGLKGAKTEVFEYSTLVEAPLGLVFNVLSDYSLRDLWSDRIKASDKLNGAVAKNGSTHRCLINDNKSDPFFVAHDFKTSSERIVFSETESRVGLTVVNELSVESKTKTRLVIHTLIKGRFIKPLIFKIFFRRKFLAAAIESNRKLNEYCISLVKSGRKPNNQVVFTTV